ncbi:MAG: FAD-dependent oxidoreductase [bacterium]
MKHVVIAGGGFAGVSLARKLKSQKDITVTIINKSSDFRYYPALYRAATGLKLGTARLPLEWMLIDTPRTKLVIDTVAKIDPAHKTIDTLSGQKISYDYAVIALGSVTTYFNIQGLPENSYGIKSPDEIIKLRTHLHDKISQKSDADENYVIVGAGPTGAELAGGLGVYVKLITKKHKIKKHRVKIWLVEAGPRILPQLSEEAARAVHKRLNKLGVNILVNTAVSKETVHTLKTSSGTIKTNTVIWTAGTANNPFFEQNSQYFNLNPKGRVIVNKHLQVQDNIYVIGDNAATPNSGLAITAVRHAKFVADDLVAHLKKKKRPKKYESSGIQVIPVGKGWAVLQFKNFVISGRLISLVRIAADYIGYSDVLGKLKAFTVWSNTEKSEEDCDTCNKSS